MLAIKKRLSEIIIQLFSIPASSWGHCCCGHLEPIQTVKLSNLYIGCSGVAEYSCKRWNAPLTRLNAPACRGLFSQLVGGAGAGGDGVQSQCCHCCFSSWKRDSSGLLSYLSWVWHTWLRTAKVLDGGCAMIQVSIPSMHREEDESGKSKKVRVAAVALGFSALPKSKHTPSAVSHDAPLLSVELRRQVCHATCGESPCSFYRESLQWSFGVAVDLKLQIQENCWQSQTFMIKYLMQCKILNTDFF